jgi:hypothetical protein
MVGEAHYTARRRIIHFRLFYALQSFRRMCSIYILLAVQRILVVVFRLYCFLARRLRRQLNEKAAGAAKPSTVFTPF